MSEWTDLDDAWLTGAAEAQGALNRICKIADRMAHENVSIRRQWQQDVAMLTFMKVLAGVQLLLIMFLLVKG